MRRSLLAVLVVAAAGCATERGAVPRNQLVATDTTLKNAQASGADRVPVAERHLELAREQYEFANKLIKEGEPRRAAYVLERAQADAELAWSLAQELATRAQAEQLLRQLEAGVPATQVPTP